MSGELSLPVEGSSTQAVKSGDRLSMALMVICTTTSLAHVHVLHMALCPGSVCKRNPTKLMAGQGRGCHGGFSSPHLHTNTHCCPLDLLRLTSRPNAHLGAVLRRHSQSK